MLFWLLRIKHKIIKVILLYSFLLHKYEITQTFQASDKQKMCHIISLLWSNIVFPALKRKLSKCHSCIVANSVQMNSESLVDKLVDGFIQIDVNTFCTLLSQFFFLLFWTMEFVALQKIHMLKKQKFYMDVLKNFPNK